MTREEERDLLAGRIMRWHKDKLGYWWIDDRSDSSIPLSWNPFLSISDAFMVWDKGDFDTIWRLIDPIQKVTKYATGYCRGQFNDVICWSRILPIENCLSPICDTLQEAITKAALKAIKGEN